MRDRRTGACRRQYRSGGLLGLACFAKHFDTKGLVIQTEQAETAGYAQQCFARCGIRGEITCREHTTVQCTNLSSASRIRWVRCTACLEPMATRQACQIDPDLIRSRGSVSAYVGAAFLCCGTVTDPQKGYHLEFTTPRTNLARDFEALLAEHEFAPRRSRRKGVNVIYLKACANIQELLTFMGAEQAAALMNTERAVKSVRNRSTAIPTVRRPTWAKWSGPIHLPSRPALSGRAGCTGDAAGSPAGDSGQKAPVS